MEFLDMKEILDDNPQVNIQDLERIQKRLEQTRRHGFRLRAPFRITKTRRAFADDDAMMRAKSVKLTVSKRSRRW